MQLVNYLLAFICLDGVVMKRILVLVVGFLMGGASAAAAAFASIFVAGFVYRHERAIPESVDLSEDYGLGLMILPVMFVCLILVFPVATYLWIKFLKKFLKTDI